MKGENKEGGESKKEKEEPKAKVQHHQANPVRYLVEYFNLVYCD